LGLRGREGVMLLSCPTGVRPRAGRSGISTGMDRSSFTLRLSRRLPFAGGGDDIEDCKTVLRSASPGIGKDFAPFSTEVVAVFNDGWGTNDSLRSNLLSFDVSPKLPLREPCLSGSFGLPGLVSEGAKKFMSGTCRARPRAKAEMDGLPVVTRVGLSGNVDEVDTRAVKS
jgi:hypothetical protein